MTERALQAYTGWLAEQIEPNRRRNISELLRQMQLKEFVYVIANDDNRVQDARDVRSDCFRQFETKPYVGLDVLGPISVLEILIGLSRRMGFMTSISPGVWAWQLLRNLELDRYSGHISRRWSVEIDDILEKLIWRQYDPDGCGGFFPLAWPREDQRNVELWYQMAAYLSEWEDPHG